MPRPRENPLNLSVLCFSEVAEPRQVIGPAPAAALSAGAMERAP